MFTISIEVPESFEVAVGDTGQNTKVDLKAILSQHPIVARYAILNGMIGALNNVSRGKNDETQAPNSDAVWAAMRDKRAAVWLTGEWSGKGGGGDRATTQLRDAFIAERMAAGATLKQADDSIKALVKATYGDKEPATFSRFMDALALMISKRDQIDEQDARTQIESKYRRLAEDAAAARAKASSVMDLSSFTL